jgi:hypothetical protein
MISLALLRDRYLGDRHASGAAPGLAAALAAIGWRAVGDPSPEELAGYLAELVDACVTEHHDTEWLVASTARLLRDSGPLLDGGLPPVAAYDAAAREVIERYAQGEAGGGSLPFPAELGR